MKIVYIGHIHFSRKALEKLIDLKAEVVGVVTKSQSASNADFCDLSEVCRREQIPFLYADNMNDKSVEEWIRSKQPDIIFCFGISQFLGKDILFAAPMGVVGYHPAMLPANRGRHPLVWALALGLAKTGSTFFFMDSGTDSGDILDQEEIKIDGKDDAAILYEKMTQVALRQIERFLSRLTQKTYRRRPQDASKANVWRKRGKEDGRIDFRMSSRAIYNLVRALARPYVGSYLVYCGEEIKVWKAKEILEKRTNEEFGKVLGVNGREVVVKCYGGAIALVEHEFKILPKPGEYLL